MGKGKKAKRHDQRGKDNGEKARDAKPVAEAIIEKVKADVTADHALGHRVKELRDKGMAWWAIGQLRREHASIQGLARQLGTTWKTVWRSVEPLLVAMAADPSRFDDVTALGVDEHVWHHVSTKPVEDGGRGPKELTGMVDLSRDQHGRVEQQVHRKPDH